MGGGPAARSRGERRDPPGRDRGNLGRARTVPWAMHLRRQASAYSVDASGPPPPPAPPLSPIERLPKWLLCVPLVTHWMLLALRHRSLTLPSAANPAIPTGGLAGEGKLECLALIPADLQSSVAPTAAVPPGADAEGVRRAAGLAFPLVAKPDCGWCGLGVQRIANPEALRRYQADFPADATFLLQAWHPGPVEAGLQVRGWPGSQPVLTGITLRHAPAVQGDGRRTLAELAAANPRLPGWLLAGQDAARVPRDGEAVPLAAIASLRVGARYEEAGDLATPALRLRVAAIAAGMGLSAGRLDVLASSVEALQAGQFTIIEVNGAGAEAIGAWDPRLGLRAAFGAVFANQRALFALGAAMRARGHRPVGPWRLAAAWLRQQRLTRAYPTSN